MIGAGVAVMAVVSAGVAAAASLGGVTSATLFTQVLPGPVIGVSDTFSGTGALAGRVSDTGQTWSTSAAGYTINGGYATASSNTTLDLAWLDNGGLTSWTADVTLTRPNNPACCGGLYLNVNAAGTSGILVTWQAAGTVVIEKDVAGTRTVLDSRSVGTFPINTATPLSVAYDNSTGKYTVALGGFASYTYTLSPADKTTFGLNTGAGLAADSNNKIEFSAFAVTP
jgi:hypothetical protein